MPLNNARILLVEDSEDDAALVVRVHRRLGRTERVDVISDPDLVLDSLKENGLPKLMLLDLKLPRRSGLELLRDIRSKVAYKGMPIVVLTSSSEPHDLALSYELGANSCLLKHVAYEESVDTLEEAFNYWLRHNLTERRVFQETA